MHSIKSHQSNNKKTLEKKYDRFIKLYLEFNDYLREHHGFYLDSRLGYCLIQEVLKKNEKELMQHIGGKGHWFKKIYDTMDFKHEEVAKSYIPAAENHRQKNEEVIKRTVRNGQNQEIMTKTLVVNLAAYWEVHLRKEVSVAYGYDDPSDYKNDIWGYIVALRNSILHNQGRVDKKLFLRAKKVRKVFKLKEQIKFNEEFAYDIFQKADGFLWKLHKESLPKSWAKLRISKSIIDESRSERARKKKYKV